MSIVGHIITIFEAAPNAAMSARLWLGEATLGNLSRKLLHRSTAKASGLSIVQVILGWPTNKYRNINC